jgi:membrane protein YfhO
LNAAEAAAAAAGGGADRRASRRGLAPREAFLLFLAPLALLAALFLGRALTGEVFLSTETVWRDVQPWRGLAPPPPAHNENLADPPTVWLPMQALTRSIVRSGESPLYTNESYAGAPWLGNMSSALFSPFTWLFVILPFEPAFAICAALKWLAAGSGAWLLARRCCAGTIGAALAGLLFAFCGFQVVWISSCLTNVAVFAPWLLLALDRLIERPSAGRTALAALAAWQVLVGGHPETSLYVGLGAAVYAAVRLAATEGRGRAVAACVAAGAVAALLAAPQWLPFLDYANHSFGRQLRLATPHLFAPLVDPLSAGGAVFCVAGLAAALYGVRMVRRDATTSRQYVGALVAFLIGGIALRVVGLRPTLVVELLPDWYGRSLDGGSYGGPLTYNDVTAGFCGAAACVLALATMLRGGDARVKALAIALLFAAARLFRVPLVSQLLDAVPQLEQTGSTRALAFVALAVALAAGIGLAGVAAGDRTLRRMVVAVLVLTAGALAPCEGIAAAASSTQRATGEGAICRLDGSLPDLTGAGEEREGATLQGTCSPEVAGVTILANGHEVGRATPAAGEGARRAWSWRWLGSQRLEEGLLRLDLQAQLRDGSLRRFDGGTVDLTRRPRPSRRWLVPLLALALLLAAPMVPSAAARVALIVIAALGDLLFFGVNYNDTTPPDRMPAAVDPIPLLQKEFAKEISEGGLFRLFPARIALHPNLHALFGLDVMRGYDALEPFRYAQYLRLLNRGQVDVPWFKLDFSTLELEPNTTGRALFDLAGFRYVLSEEPAPAGFIERWRRGELVLYENPTAFHRAFTRQRFMSVADMQARHEDPCAAAAWEEPGEGSFAGSAKVVAFTHERGTLRATVESEQGTILIVTENAAGFRATIDGVEEPVRTTHGCFLSVKVPAGHHEVVFRYWPEAVVRGLLAGGIGLLLMSALSVLTLRRGPAAETAG